MSILKHYLFKKEKKERSLGDINQGNYIKIADSVRLSLYMRDYEKVQHPSGSLAPA
jgi:hypothetical protein